MKKTYVLDTNVLLHDPTAIYKFQDNHIVIPLVVVEEVDKFKRDQTEVGRNARVISRFLDREREKGHLNEGVELSGGGELKVVFHSEPVKMGTSPSHTADNYILGVALHHSNGGDSPCILVTKDANLRIKADA